MDLTFKTDKGIFNYRASAVIIRNNKLLIMKDDKCLHYYLPGGRVKYNETVENAVLREIKEELGIKAKIIRPLCFAQTFFDFDEHTHCHEISVYYLTQIPNDVLTDINGKYYGIEENKKQIFEWTDINKLNDICFYPLFIKDKILNLPDYPHFIAQRE